MDFVGDEERSMEDTVADNSHGRAYKGDSADLGLGCMGNHREGGKQAQRVLSVEPDRREALEGRLVRIVMDTGMMKAMPLSSCANSQSRC